MFTWLAKWSVKTWALDFINGLLEKYKDNVQAALAIVDTAIDKVEKVLAYLKSVREKLADNKVTDEEGDAIVSEGEALIKELFA